MLFVATILHPLNMEPTMHPSSFRVSSTSMYTKSVIFCCLTYTLQSGLACMGLENQPQAEQLPISTTATESTTPREKVFWSESFLDLPAFVTPEMQKLLNDGNSDVFLQKLQEYKPTSTIEKQKQEILYAWVALQSKQPTLAINSLQSVFSYQDIPEDYRNYILANIKIVSDEFDPAKSFLEKIPTDSPLHNKAKWTLIYALLKKEDTANTTKSGTVSDTTKQLLEELVNQSHPFASGDEALYRLAKHHGLKNTNAYPLLRKLWSFYPSSEITQNTSSDLKAFEAKGKSFQPTLADWNARAEVLMDNWAWKKVITELTPIAQGLQPNSADSCQLLFNVGRSHFKDNSITKASEILTPVGKSCAGINDDAGAKAWYISGKGLERKKMWAEAAEAFMQIPVMYPSHSMADDGYALAGIGFQESGNRKKAVEMWEKQVAEYPTGDLIGEGYWRLAWNSYLDGDTSKALEWVTSAQTIVPATDAPYEYFAFPYWEARWRVFPNKTEPKKQNTDSSEVQKGISIWKKMVVEHPTEFYSLLAANRLYELDNTWMQNQKTPVYKQEKGWWVSPGLIDNSSVLRATQLSSLGMRLSASKELQPISKDSPTLQSMYTFMYKDINWYIAHDSMHKYIQNHGPHTWEDNFGQLFYQTYPNTHWDTLKTLAPNYKYDVRIFHALVREESSFNPEIVSWAGAKGLSQLMPATAKQVGGWLGITVTDSNIFDPKTNLTIGSRYLDYLCGYFKGNMFLAVAAYNAGEGNVGKWLQNKGNLPTDEFIESIPIRETRHYVKRVMGTYQSYHILYDKGPMFLDLHQFNHQAQPK